ncbi:MAG TPA: class I SAM-dependent methyltransferase [Anaerolineae bacterium]|nr:class I SAM-dependent methyltransferase [Anaerolineae bacterium]
MKRFVRKVRSAIRLYRDRKHLRADLALAIRHVRDLAWIYARRPNDEVAYYNLLFAVAMAAQPAVIVELGTGPGLSSLAFVRVLQYIRQTQPTLQPVLHSCDINPMALAPLKRFGSIVHLHTMSSDDLAAHWATDAPAIYLLYIDAAHSHEQSLADFEHFSQWVRPNGLILLHDTFPRSERDEAPCASGSVWKTVQYVKAHYPNEFEVMTIPHLAGVSLLRRRGAKYF